MSPPIATAPAYRKHVDRRLFIGGSDARVIMGSDEAALTRLWQEKRGEAKPPDYSENLIVQLGGATEPLNRCWYERTTGQVIKDVQSGIRHPVIRWTMPFNRVGRAGLNSTSSSFV
jgi:predicted phage-related endonuclease